MKKIIHYLIVLLFCCVIALIIFHRIQEIRDSFELYFALFWIAIGIGLISMLMILRDMKNIEIKKDLLWIVFESIVFSIGFAMILSLTIGFDFGTLWFLWVLPFVPYAGLIVKVLIEKKKK